MSFYDLSAVDIDGKTRSFSEWKGKVIDSLDVVLYYLLNDTWKLSQVLMITNVASACGYTHKATISIFTIQFERIYLFEL